MEQACNTTVSGNKAPDIYEKICLQVKQLSSHLVEVEISIDKAIKEGVLKQAFLIFKKIAVANGLNDVPLSYIEQNYKSEINNYVENFIYNHFILDYLLEEIVNKKIYITNSPRLREIKDISDGGMIYKFEISVADQINIREWKNFVFKSPKRKNYKDLDKQVELFIKKTQESSKISNPETISEGDWVGFKSQILTPEGSIEFLEHGTLFWIYIVPHIIKNSFVNFFLNKKLNDSFQLTNLPISENNNMLFADQSNLHNNFLISINTIAKGSNTSLDIIKSIFKLPNKESLHDKLIEVFSYRNDQSQRRAIIEEMFHLILSKHRFEIAKHLVLRKQEEILSYLQKRPDFEAYRSQYDFQKQLASLAEKQLKEEIIIDQIAHAEKIKVEMKDVQNYLSLISSPRLKEFIYFRSLFDYTDDLSQPIHHCIIKQVCKREKTLNHILFHLTK